MAGRHNFPNRIEKRKLEAAARNEAYAKLTDEQKLERLTQSGVTSGKQFNRLTARISNKK